MARKKKRPATEDVDMDAALNEPEIRRALAKFCKEHGLDLNNLPSGLTASDLIDRIPRTDGDGTVEPWWVEYDAIARGEKSRPIGAPRKGAPPVAWTEIDHLLVTGELTAEGRVYPTTAELAERFNVSRQAIERYAKLNGVEGRRLSFAEKTERAQEDAAVAVDVARVVSSREKARLAVDLYLDGFIDALRKGRVQTNSVDDLDKIVRILDRLDGGPDKVVEHQHSLTLETIQQRFERAKRGLGVEAPVGIAPPNDRKQLPIAVKKSQDVVDVEAKDAS